MLKTFASPAIALAAFLTQALPAAACGGLVAPNGAIHLARATTLVEWHDGVEHYMTSFTYQGAASNFGWIVPLPAVPIKIEEGGAWTLQRLFRETRPQRREAFFALSNQADSVEVLQKTKVEALDITVLRGSGQAVLDWAAKNDFVLSPETSDHLLVYAHSSPIFMAAKYDVAAARARGQLQGDGAPVLITMKTAHPWIPLEILALGTATVKADLYLLTDQPVNTTDVGAIVGEEAVGQSIPGAPGFKLQFQERLNPALYRDLSTDRNMGWVRPDSWLTYMSLDAPSRTVTYDMGITPTGVIRLGRFGTSPMAIVDRKPSPAIPTLPLGTARALAVLVAVVVAGAVLLWIRRPA